MTHQLPNLVLNASSFMAMCFCVSFTVPAAAQLTGSLRLHDPSRILEENGRYYLFHTGNFIGSKYSDNLVNWSNGPTVFAAVPSWADDAVANNNNNMWAPGVIEYNGEYRLYYSLSSFGSQDSVIGLATNTTLDFTSPDYQWVDQGLVIESGGTPYNAIDASIFYDEDLDRMWMTFGSYWNGIYMTELDPATGKRFGRATVFNVARNTSSSADAIEASYLMEHDDIYYLFVNWDTCCAGVDSTYNIRVGRSTNPTGPFLDRSGKAMISGGGDLFLETEGDFIGPGHFGYFAEDGVEYFGYHYYDGNDRGRSKYNLEQLAWTADGWPIPATDLLPGDFNGDGEVDESDLSVWNDFYGITTDGLDLMDWQRNFGTQLATGSLNLVPEPTALALSTLLLLSTAIGRRALPLRVAAKRLAATRKGSVLRVRR